LPNGNNPVAAVNMPFDANRTLLGGDRDGDGDVTTSSPTGCGNLNGSIALAHPLSGAWLA